MQQCTILTRTNAHILARLYGGFGPDINARNDILPARVAAYHETCHHVFAINNFLG